MKDSMNKFMNVENQIINFSSSATANLGIWFSSADLLLMPFTSRKYTKSGTNDDGEQRCNQKKEGNENRTSNAGLQYRHG